MTTPREVSQLHLRPFQSQDQAAVRDLILAGMGERWGWIDETANPDLDDIAAYYGRGVFLVAVSDGEPVGTGALLPEAPGVMRIVRMSVASTQRRQGIGRRILAALLAEALQRGCHTVDLETTSTWEDAVAFYTAAGFEAVATDAEETHMRLRLTG